MIDHIYIYMYHIIYHNHIYIYHIIISYIHIIIIFTHICIFTLSSSIFPNTIWVPSGCHDGTQVPSTVVAVGQSGGFLREAAKARRRIWEIPGKKRRVCSHKVVPP